MFAGKAFAVTGATSGIGKEIAVKLINENAMVYICGRRQERLNELLSRFPSINTTCLDLTDWNAVERWITYIPKLDGLINNAGISIPEPCHQITKESLEKIISTNLTAPLHLTQMFAKKLIDGAHSGCIVNISSVAAIKALPCRVVYSSTKAAVNQMTRSAAFELGKHNIRVNAVCPTLVETELTKRLWKKEEFEEFEEALPLKSIPSTHDIADATLFLLSEKAKMITGQTLYVDSGATV